jgi:hypothetical protein
MDTNDCIAEIGELNYDITILKAKPGNQELLNKIRDSLNKMFPDAKCISVTYTMNIDKMFFGIITLPIFSDEEIASILLDDDEMKVKKYKLELDSKLFCDTLDLSTDEITALIVHEVSRLVTDCTPITCTRNLIDEYATNLGTVIKIPKFDPYLSIIGYGIKEIARRSVSIFENTYLIPHTLDEQYQLTDALQNAIKTIEAKGNLWNKEIDNKSIIIQWVLRLYNNILKYRIAALHSLKKGIDLIGSTLIKNELKNLIESLNKIDDFNLIQQESNSIKDFFNNNKKENLSALDRFKANGIKNYYDDLYEIQFEYNNMDGDRGMAISLLHRINARLSVLDDYISTEEGLNSQTIRKLQDLYFKYEKLRNDISSQKLKSPQTLLINV